jgi:hypothetical protein
MMTRLFKFAAIGSLATAIAIAGIWGRSVFRKDHIGIVATHWTASVTSADGLVWVGYGTSPIPASSEEWRFSSEPITATDVRLQEFGYQEDVFNLPKGGTARIHQWWFPYWMGMLIAAGVPGAYAVKQRVASGRKAGTTCRLCGYDLRATPDRCPECGTIPAERMAEG